MEPSGKFGVAVVGCGTVGNAVAALLLSGSQRYESLTGGGISLKALVGLNFDKARRAGLDESLFNSSIDKVLADPEVHLIVETVGGLTDARAIIEEALKAGKHVVTANKALLAHHGPGLFALARQQGVSIGFEASCAGGIPIVRALVDGLLANTNEALYGIVNGTSNFILTEMVEKGRNYAEALSRAQKAGLAEADPTLDVSGMDAAHKLTLLGSLAFGERIPLESIPVAGIEGLDLFDVSAGTGLGYVLKLVAMARRTEGELETFVKPVFMPNDHPLARVSGPFNAISVYSDAVGHTMYYGRGAGGRPTASAVVSDILSIALGTWPALFSRLPVWPDRNPPGKLASPGELVHRYYLRFRIRDQSGAVAEITAALAQEGISLTAFVQKEAHEGNLVPVVITTHEAREQNIDRAFKAIRGLPSVGDGAVRIPIIDEHAEFG